MKTLLETIFDTDANKDLTFKELTGANIERPHEKDLVILTKWIKENTNIDHYVSPINWKVGYSINGNGFCIYKDVFAQFDGEKRPSMHRRESILQISYNSREEGVLFIARTNSKKKIPESCTFEWKIINEIIEAFGASLWYSDNWWFLDVKP